jgi:hypothetical protein
LARLSETNGESSPIPAAATWMDELRGRGMVRPPAQKLEAAALELQALASRSTI